MADFVTLDDGGLAVKLDPEGQEAAIMITKDGEVSFVSVTPEDARRRTYGLPKVLRPHCPIRNCSKKSGRSLNAHTN